MDAQSLQERYAARSTCFGCGPANAKGLRIRSFASGDHVVAEWTAQPHHEAYPGALNGGVIGTLLDCHMNWAAAHHLMRRDSLEHPPATVTAEYSIRMTRPTPTDKALRLIARVVQDRPDRAIVEGRIEAEGVTCAKARGTFVAVKPGHPAYHRW
ncbi:MAG: thioesterase [Chloroflexi bacterium 13_1_40CM_4_68_4]|nr:MAG: thioesterase [Chloroflexi bacterium 13_1_40CM_4_68_4]